MKINRKFQNIGLIVVASIAFIGFIIGCFTEQKLTQNVGNFDSLFGIMFTGFGPLPLLALGTLAGLLLIFMPRIENNNWNIMIRILGGAAVLAMIFAEIKEGLDYLDFPRMQEQEATYKVLMLVCIAILNLFLILFSRIWVKKTDQKLLMPLCTTIVVVIALYFVTGEAIKYMASRPRPRVVILENRLYYKQWFEWKPLAALLDESYKDCKSFVSGHASNTACLITVLPLTIALFKKENSNKLQIAAIAIGALYAFVVAYSRIVAYAHWLTDVAGGIMVSCCIQALIINLAPIVINKFQNLH